MKRYNLLVNLRQLWNISNDVPVKLDKLIKLEEKIEKVVENSKAKVNSYLANLETIPNDIIGMLEGKVDRTIAGAPTALKNRNYQPVRLQMLVGSANK